MWRSFVAAAWACGPYRQLWSPWRQQQMIPSDEHHCLLFLRTFSFLPLLGASGPAAVSEGVHERRDAAC